jgi:hypothetical protein
MGAASSALKMDALPVPQAPHLRTMVTKKNSGAEMHLCSRVRVFEAHGRLHESGMYLYSTSGEHFKRPLHARFGRLPVSARLRICRLMAALMVLCMTGGSILGQVMDAKQEDTSSVDWGSEGRGTCNAGAPIVGSRGLGHQSKP